MSKFSLSFIVLLFISCSMLAAGAALAAADNVAVDPNCPASAPKGSICLQNPLKTDTTDVSEIIGIVINGVLGVIGSVALVMLVWGGFQWLTSAGNKERVQKGTKTITWAVIGVVLVFASYMILNTVLEYLGGK